jgi:pimeloyl-ACP methyl ester carboxylesterase
MRTKAGAIAFDDQGHGEPALLCLAGWCADRSAYQDLVPACSRHRRTIAIDWRGHGESAKASGDFGESGLLEDALAVIADCGIDQVVPVALAHSGWVAIELRRRLGDRVPAIVLVDWLVLDPPPPFLGALVSLRDPDRWQATRSQLFSMWLEGVDDPKVTRLVREVMGSQGFEMWARAGREIAAAYRREGNPLKSLAGFRPPPRVMHIYAQPTDSGFLQAQQAFAAANPWFSVRRLAAKSHFPMLEVPQEIAGAIESLLAHQSV